MSVLHERDLCKSAEPIEMPFGAWSVSSSQRTMYSPLCGSQKLQLEICNNFEVTGGRLHLNSTLQITIYIHWVSHVTQSMVTIRLPFCGYNLA